VAYRLLRLADSLNERISHLREFVYAVSWLPCECRKSQTVKCIKCVADDTLRRDNDMANKGVKKNGK